MLLYRNGPRDFTVPTKSLLLVAIIQPIEYICHTCMHVRSRCKKSSYHLIIHQNSVKGRGVGDACIMYIYKMQCSHPSSMYYYRIMYYQLSWLLNIWTIEFAYSTWSKGIYVFHDIMFDQILCVHFLNHVINIQLWLIAWRVFNICNCWKQN